MEVSVYQRQVGDKRPNMAHGCNALTRRVGFVARLEVDPSEATSLPLDPCPSGFLKDGTLLGCQNDGSVWGHRRVIRGG